MRMARIYLAAASALALANAAGAAEDAAAVGEVIVVAPTPLPGGGVDPAKLPGVTETLGGSAFARTNALAVTRALEQRVAGVSLSDAQGNPFTKDLNFRGFQASPLQGTPQGLAVYMGGVRLNEAFGDTVNWDLIPEVAIRRANLFTSNPAFGLNALGGAVTLQMKTGFDAPGGQAIAQGGSFGRLSGSAEYGVSRGSWSLYIAADGGDDDGWRLHSPSRVLRGYADVGWRGGPAEIHLVATAASNDFGVVGPTPVDLLRKNGEAVYTYPQRSRNTVGLFAVSGSYKLSDAWSLQGDAYLRTFNQHHVDGNDGDFEGCSRTPTNPLFNTLCLEDDDFPAELRPPAAAFQVQTLAGAPVGCPPALPGQNGPCNGVPYGSVDRTRTDADTLGASLQATSSASLHGRPNALAFGASLDHSRARFSANSQLAIIQPDLLVDPTPGPAPGVGQIIRTAGAIAFTPVEVRSRTTYLGAYATDTLDVTDRLSLTLSGRFNRARVAMLDLGGVSPELNGTHHFNRFNPGLGAAWRATDSVTAYAGYSEANRVPTALELGCSDPLKPCLLENALVADPPLKQVVSRSWEAGLRGQPRLGDGRLKWRLGVFQADNDDDIVALASALQGRGYFANVPKTRRRGFEASAEFESERWLVYAGYSRIRATYRFAGDLPSPNSPFADDDGNVRVEPGDRIGGIPRGRFKAGGDVELLPRLTVGADAVAVSGQYLVGDEANRDDRLKSYWTASLHATWAVSPRLQVFGRVDNLFDSRRATYGTYFETDGLADLDPAPFDDDSDPRTVTPLAPRAFLIGVRATW